MIAIQPHSYHNTPNHMSKNHLITTQQITNNPLRSRLYFLHTSEITSYEDFFSKISKTESRIMWNVFFDQLHHFYVNEFILTNEILWFETTFRCYYHHNLWDNTLTTHTTSSFQTVPNMIVSIHIKVKFHIVSWHSIKRKYPILTHISA